MMTVDDDGIMWMVRNVERFYRLEKSELNGHNTAMVRRSEANDHKPSVSVVDGHWISFAA